MLRKIGCQAFDHIAEARVPKKSGCLRKIGCQAFEHVAEDRVLPSGVQGDGASVLE